MKYTCKQYGKEFEITEGEAEFYRSKGLNLPKRCKECREENKSGKSGNNSKSSETGTTRMPQRESSGMKINNKTIKTVISILTVVLAIIVGLVSIANKNTLDKDDYGGTSTDLSYYTDITYDEETDNYTEDTEAEETEESEEAIAESWETESQTTAESTTKQTTTKQTTTKATTTKSNKIDVNGSYFSKNEVALYIHTYGHLPNNFITKNQAKALGWEGGSVQKYAPGKAIGGDRFGNYEEQLPTASGRVYYECDINTNGKSSRGAERIIYSNDGLVYYTSDHYENFTRLY